MLTLVTGGSASGKSEYAEQCILTSRAEKRIYIATMQPFDIECDARIQKHRRARSGRSFETIECYVRLDGVVVPKDSAVLLECMSNLVANEIYSLDGAGACAYNAVMCGIRSLCAQARDVVIVSNEVFSDGIDYGKETMAYLSVLGRVNQAVAHMADRVVEVVYTIPVVRKGAE